MFSTLAMSAGVASRLCLQQPVPHVPHRHQSILWNLSLIEKNPEKILKSTIDYPGAFYIRSLESR